MNTAGTLVRIVDDDPTICDSLSLFLLSFGWAVKAYASGREFLVGDSLSIPGCVILDVRMPGMTGIEVQHELKARGSFVPVLFLSAHGDIEMAVRAVQEGAFTFFEKPPVPEKILEAVQRAAEKSVMEKREARDRERGLALWESLTPAEKQRRFSLRRACATKRSRRRVASRPGPRRRGGRRCTRSSRLRCRSMWRTSCGKFRSSARGGGCGFGEDAHLSECVTRLEIRF